MAGQGDVVDVGTRGRIDDRQATITISDENVPRGGIGPDIVRVVAERDASYGRQIGGAACPHRAVAGTGYKDKILISNIGEPLRLVQAANPLGDFPGLKVDDIDA